MSTCPCCGQEFEPQNAIGITVDGNSVYRNGQVVNLTKTQSTILHMLTRAGNRGVNYEAVCDAVYFMKEGPEMELRSLRVIISKMRRLIAPLGVFVDNVYGIGWRIRVERSTWEAEAG